MQLDRDAKASGCEEPMTDAPPECRCAGTGAYTVEIPLADAVVSDRRLCRSHGLYPRARVYDTTHGRTGVVMEVVSSIAGDSVWLRPLTGGIEWKTTVGSLRPSPEAL